MSAAILLIQLTFMSVLAIANERPNKPGELPPYKPLAERTNYEKLFVYRCETIFDTIGFNETPTGRATKYSCDGPNIGIALYAGEDLGRHPPENIAQYFIDEIAKYGIGAKVFIKHNHPHGSSMEFYINGDSWLNDPIRPSNAVKKIEALAAEAKLLLYTAGKLQEWPMNASTQ